MPRTMISDPVIAKKISELMIETLARLDESTAMAMNACQPEEFKAYRRAAGAVMAEIASEILNPLYSMHPLLKPPEME